ncbi:cyanophycinase, partial [Francisella tularensis subsp. holarctica]|nr:cyanophycinase [Francisella tularensis subsp. holarctica]
KYHRGYKKPIGCREDKLEIPTVLEKFDQLTCRTEAKIAVIPKATKLPDTGHIYVDIFTKM